MRYSHLNIAALAVAALSGLASCSDDAMSEFERTETAFTDQIGGEISPLQWWRTAVKLNVTVTTDAPAHLWLMQGNDKGLLYDYKEVDASSQVTMIAPQGQGNTLYLVAVSDRQKVVKPVVLTGRQEENVTFDLRPSREKTPESISRPPLTVDASLYGSSIAGNAQLYELTAEQRAEAFDLLNRVWKEKVPAKSVGANCDYELKSNGDFRVTWFGGSCLSTTPHVLGYYYHTPGTYSDIQYVDLAEAEIYDYIDGLAKVQYKVNEAAAAQWGVSADHWYDANFDMGDTFINPHPNLNARRGDDAYNTLDVYNRYDGNITALRGLSFEIKVPEGMYVGFYLKAGTNPCPEQYDRFERIGIKPYTSRDRFMTMNFSCEAMNMNVNGSYRSCVYKTDHALWMGMENDDTGGDLDCNDVIFEISADLEIHQPSIVEPDLEPFGEYDGIMPWTIAYEDAAREADFDFNDAVIKILPNKENETCDVTVMAAGTTAKMYLHYDGPDGDVNLGEIHELLGATSDRTINTNTTVPSVPFKSIGSVKWLKTYSVTEDASRFYIEVKRGTCADCSSVIELADERGRMPEAILVAGEWKWPKEGVSIFNAYPSFADWCKDVTNQQIWNWYATPKSQTCVEY